MDTPIDDMYDFMIFMIHHDSIFGAKKNVMLHCRGEVTRGYHHVPPQMDVGARNVTICGPCLPRDWKVRLVSRALAANDLNLWEIRVFTLAWVKAMFGTTFNYIPHKIQVWIGVIILYMLQKRHMIHSLTHSFIQSVSQSFIHSFIPSFILSLSLY